MIFKKWEDLEGKTITGVKKFKCDNGNNECEWVVLIFKEGIVIQEYYQEDNDWGWVNLIDIEKLFKKPEHHQIYNYQYDLMPEELKAIINQYKQIENDNS